MSAPVPLILQQHPDTTRGWMRGAVALGNPAVPLTIQNHPPTTAGYLRPGVPLGNPNVPISLQVRPNSVTDWMRWPARGPNPNVPVTPQIHPATTAGWLRGVARRPNPGPGLDGWYPLTSAGDYERFGAPVMGPWVEQLDPKLPANGILHRLGMPDVQVRVIWNAGCQLYPSGAHVCKAFVRELAPADMIRFRTPQGVQGRAMAHKLYTTPGGNLVTNPRVVVTDVTYKRAWLPASFTNMKPSGIAGSWVQVSPAEQRVGIVHIPGMGPQQVFVMQVKNDAWGRPRALVQWRSLSSMTRQSNNGANEGTFVVQSKIAPMTGKVRHDITQVPRRTPLGRPLGTARTNPGHAVSAASVRARLRHAASRVKNVLHRMPWHGG